MTGYHAWVFPFVAAAFHLPVFFCSAWSIALEARVIGCVMLFWVIEDFLWFIFNPAFGFAKLQPEYAHWHKSWFGPVPTDYVTFGVGALLLIAYSYRLFAGRSKRVD